MIIQQLYSFKHQKNQSCLFFIIIQTFCSHSPLPQRFPSSHYALLGRMQTPGIFLGRSSTTWKLFYVNVVQSRRRCISLIELGSWWPYILKEGGFQHPQLSDVKGSKIFNLIKFLFPNFQTGIQNFLEILWWKFVCIWSILQKSILRLGISAPFLKILCPRAAQYLS